MAEIIGTSIPLDVRERENTHARDSLNGVGSGKQREREK